MKKTILFLFLSFLTVSLMAQNYDLNSSVGLIVDSPAPGSTSAPDPSIKKYCKYRINAITGSGCPGKYKVGKIICILCTPRITTCPNLSALKVVGTNCVMQVTLRPGGCQQCGSAINSIKAEWHNPETYED